MGLIIKDKIQMLMTGFPTISDKYNVAGATLAGSTNVHFGDLLKKSSTVGYFEAIASSISSVDDLGGFIVGTNVKLADGFPGGEPVTKPGEAFNLLVNGFIAIKLDSGATTSYITPNAPVLVIYATGKCTTSDKASDDTIVAIPNVYFTGTYELHGSDIIAEIYVK